MKVLRVRRGQPFEEREDDVEILLRGDDLRIEVGRLGEITDLEGLGVVAALDGSFRLFAARKQTDAGAQANGKEMRSEHGPRSTAFDTMQCQN